MMETGPVPHSLTRRKHGTADSDISNEREEKEQPEPSSEKERETEREAEDEELSSASTSTGLHSVKLSRAPSPLARDRTACSPTLALPWQQHEQQ